jgi:hypothetical protein
MPNGFPPAAVCTALQKASATLSSPFKSVASLGQRPGEKLDYVGLHMETLWNRANTLMRRKDIRAAVDALAAALLDRCFSGDARMLSPVSGSSPS